MLARRLLPAVFALFALVAAAPLAAGEVSAVLTDSAPGSATFSIQNSHAFPVKFVGVRLTFQQDDGTRRFVLSAPVDVDLEPTQAWTGTLQFPDAGDLDLAYNDAISAGIGIAIEPIVQAAEAAIAAGEQAALVEQRNILRERIAAISPSARFHADQIEASGIDRAAYFDLARLDALLERIEETLCGEASRRIIEAPNNTRRNEVYLELAPELREIGLHITCINSEAKLAAARMLLAGERPQDALLFKEVDAEGNLLPEWRPIFITANLALARTAAELNVSVLSSIRPAVDAINEVHALEPDNAELRQLAPRVVMLAAGYIRDAAGIVNRDLPNAMTMLGLLRPTWDAVPGLLPAAGAVATALVESGLAFCERREFVNARNDFVRGERILRGIPEWDTRAPEINRCRALGALAEGVELANHPTDPTGPERGFAKLEEAQQRYELTQAEIDGFKAAIASGWVAVANRYLDEFSFTGADNALVAAETVSPTGMTDAIRDGWIRYAEQRFAREGFLMSGANVTDARRALAKVGEYAPDRVGAISSRLTMAYYGYRVGLPLLAVVFGVLAWLYTVASRARAKRLAAMVDAD